MSQTSEIVVKSEPFQSKIAHLNKKDISERLALKELRKTLDKLKLNSTKESKDQMKVLGASVTSIEHGPPDLGFHSTQNRELIEMKRNLLSGEEKILKTPSKAPKMIFPPEVRTIAINHWEEITITEPAKHRYTTKAVSYTHLTLPTTPYV